MTTILLRWRVWISYRLIYLRMYRPATGLDKDNSTSERSLTSIALGQCAYFSRT